MDTLVNFFGTPLVPKSSQNLSKSSNVWKSLESTAAHRVSNVPKAATISVNITSLCPRGGQLMAWIMMTSSSWQVLFCSTALLIIISARREPMKNDGHKRARAWIVQRAKKDDCIGRKRSRHLIKLIAGQIFVFGPVDGCCHKPISSNGYNHACIILPWQWVTRKTTLGILTPWDPWIHSERIWSTNEGLL